MNNRKLLLLSLTLLVFSSVFITSCKEEDDDQVSSTKLVADYDNEASLRWNKVFLEVERYAQGYRPGPAPRALGLMGLAAYEACITGMPDYNSLEARFAGMNLPNVDASAEYHWPTVVHSVYTTMMPLFFLGNNQQYNAGVMNQWNGLVSELNDKYLNEAGSEVFNRSLAYGQAVGQAMWAYSTTDTYGDNAYKNPFGNFNTNETYDWAQHYDAPGDWEPTYPGPTNPMGPFYGNARGWVLNESDKICLPPSAYFMQYSENPNSEYYSQAIQVYTKNANTDYITEWIGEYWSDDLVDLTFSPGPRWIAIGNQIIENEGSNLETALEAYAKTGMALSDAAKGAWASKYYYNVERPETYIKNIIDSTYEPNLYNPINGWEGFTPPFPAYPSGHSTMGAAGAEALASVFGYSYAMTDNCHVGRTEFEGTPRAFGSLYEMALENAWSRVLLGVHWRMDCDEGVRFGTVIGRKINALPWKK
jgi:membrane-associated phospholipid phosphatase